MSRMFAGVVSALALALAVVVEAQSGITGKWQGQTDGGSQITLDFTVKGTELLGTLTRNEEKVAIEKGKVSKNTLTFSATLGGQAEDLSGELKEDQLLIWLNRQGPERAVTFKRVKKE